MASWLVRADTEEAAQGHPGACKGARSRARAPEFRAAGALRVGGVGTCGGRAKRARHLRAERARKPRNHHLGMVRINGAPRFTFYP